MKKYSTLLRALELEPHYPFLLVGGAKLFAGDAIKPATCFVNMG